MGENLLCLRVSTSRYPTAASSHRTPILRCTVKVSSTHIDGFYTLGCLAFEVLQRDHTIMLFLQEDSVVPVDNSGFKQYDSEYAKISNQSLTRMYLCGQTETLWLFFVCLVFFLFWSAWCPPHGHDDEPRRFMAKQSWLIPEGAWSEHGACSRAWQWGGVCAHRGRLPHFQPQV